VFRVDMPSPNQPIAVRARPERKLREVLRQILRRNGFDVDGMYVYVGSTDVRINDDSFVSSLDCVHLRVQSRDVVPRGL